MFTGQKAPSWTPHFQKPRTFPKSLPSLFFAIAIIATGISFSFTQAAQAAGLTCEWTGLGGDANWSTASNWDNCGGSAPTDGDNLWFSVNPARNTSTNDLVGIDLDSIYIQAGNMTFNGNAISLTPTIQQALLFNGGDNDWAINTTINGSANRQIYAVSDQDNTISGNIVLNITGSANFLFGNNDLSSSLEITGDISGSVAGILYANNGAGQVAYRGNNTFTADVSSGSMTTCHTNTCLGDASNTITINGNAVTFDSVNFANPIAYTSGGAGTYSIGAVTLSGNITLTAPVITIYANTGSDLTLSGNIDTNTHSIYFQGPGTISQSGVISGSGPIEVQTDATFAGNNTFTGDVDIQFNETLTVSSNNGLGTTAGITIIQNGATLVAGTSFGLTNIPEDITVEGIGVGGIGAIRKTQSNGSATILSGTVTLIDDVFFYVGGNTELSFSGQVTGPGGITFSAGNEVGRSSFTGTQANDYEGDTVLESLSNLTLAKTDNIVAVPGDLTAHGDTGPSVVILFADEQIADDSHVTLFAENSSANIYSTIDVQEMIGMLEGDGEVQLSDPGATIKVGADNSNGEFSGSIGAAGSTFIKVGTGVWTLSGTNNANAGQFVNYVVQDGELIANFSDASGANTPFSIDGGLLGGTGIIGNTESIDGNIAPGNSPGCLNPASLTLNSASTLDIEINSATPCSGYDIVDSSGAVNLGSATLNVVLGYSPAAGTTFTIVEGSSLTGIFAGLANSATFTRGTTNFRINYTSNSVVLTAFASGEVIPAPISPISPTSDTLPVTGIAIGLSVLTAFVLLFTGLFFRSRFSSTQREFPSARA